MEELVILEHIKVALLRVGSDQCGGLIMKHWVGGKDDVFEGTISVAIRGKHNMGNAAVFREHIFTGKEAINWLGHALEFEFHEGGEVGIGIIGHSEATGATCVGAEAPEGVDVKTEVHTALGKFRIPGANASMSVIDARKSGFGKFFVVERILKKEQGAVGYNQFVWGFKMMTITMIEGLGNGRAKDGFVGKAVEITLKD